MAWWDEILDNVTNILDWKDREEAAEYNETKGKYNREVDQRTLSIYIRNQGREQDFLRREADIFRARAGGADFDALYHERQSELYRGRADYLRTHGSYAIDQYEDQLQAKLVSDRAGLDAIGARLRADQDNLDQEMAQIRIARDTMDQTDAEAVATLDARLANLSVERAQLDQTLQQRLVVNDAEAFELQVREARLGEATTERIETHEAEIESVEARLRLVQVEHEIATGRAREEAHRGIGAARATEIARGGRGSFQVGEAARLRTELGRETRLLDARQAAQVEGLEAQRERAEADITGARTTFQIQQAQLGTRGAQLGAERASALMGHAVGVSDLAVARQDVRQARVSQQAQSAVRRAELAAGEVAVTGRRGEIDARMVQEAADRAALDVQEMWAPFEVQARRVENQIETSAAEYEAGKHKGAAVDKRTEAQSFRIGADRKDSDRVTAAENTALAVWMKDNAPDVPNYSPGWGTTLLQGATLLTRDD